MPTQVLRNTGIRVERKRASVIIVEMKDQLWECGVLGMSFPAALQNAVFSIMEKSFAYVGFKSSTTFLLATSMNQRTTVEEFMTTNLTTNV